MNLTAFLKQIDESPNLGTCVLSFSYSQDSSLFFSNFLKYLKLKLGSILSISAEQLSFDQIRAQLEISFLNNSSIYWIKDIPDLHQKNKTQLLNYILSYSGPHKIIFADLVSEKTSAENSIIIPDSLNIISYKELFNIFYPNTPIDPAFIKNIFLTHETIPLDTACLLMAYQSVAGKNGQLFFSTWFNKILSKERSLFTLSQYFFAQQSREFFSYWSTIKTDYPDEFWVVYWSEQLWQATLFITRANSSGILLAKQKASRLPFSFINKDWRLYTLQSLASAHQSLYLIDHNLKNSLATYDLDLWLHKFFAKRF